MFPFAPSQQQFPAPPSPPQVSPYVQARAGPTVPAMRRRTGSSKGPSSPSDLSYPSSPAFNDSEHQSEEYWSHLVSPLVKQTTHRKQDYGTILSVLVSINSGNPSIIKSVEEAEEISREVGVWFIVRGSERSVVKLGIGANPGLKKYYWRAESSKRLLKREMDADPGHASLVYIIQKAATVSKRCASIPGTDLWLVMYLPATLRAAEALNNQGPTPTRKVGPSSRPQSPSAVSPSSLDLGSSSSDESSSDDDIIEGTRNKRQRPGRASPKPHGESSPVLTSSSLPSDDAIDTSKTFDAFCPLPSVDDNGSGESTKRQRRAGPSAVASSSATSFDEMPKIASTLPYDINPTGDFFDSCLVSHTCPPFLFDTPSFDTAFEFSFLSPADTDPFLPLAGSQSQTLGSAAIEAACMSGARTSWMSTFPSDFLLTDVSY